MRKFFLFALISLTVLQGCAQSDLSRNAASGVDDTYTGISTSVSSIGKSSLAESYQNTSQTTKGVLIGGATGALVGTTMTGVGTLGGAAIGAIMLGAIGAYIDANSTLVDKIQNRGGKVFVLGDQVLIVLPSSRIFNENTANINYAAASTLDLVSELIGSYVNMSVKISAYTDTQGATLIDQALSQQQANKVEKYLWAHGVNTRMIYAMGYGGTHLVTKSTCDWNSENYRIEITLEKLPA